MLLLLLLTLFKESHAHIHDIASSWAPVGAKNVPRAESPDYKKGKLRAGSLRNTFVTGADSPGYTCLLLGWQP